jgi:hypothetical protein
MPLAPDTEPFTDKRRCSGGLSVVEEDQLRLYALADLFHSTVSRILLRKAQAD